MKRLGISVEGPTERDFVTQVLRPHLLLYGWQLIQPISMNGGVSLARVREELRRLQNQFDCVSTLYDFYKFEGRGQHTIDELESQIHASVGNSSALLPYIQRHEFEALLFSGPTQLAAKFPKTPKGLIEIRRILQTVQDQPEEINHGYATCPSRRLKALFPTYDKVRHGPGLAKDIGLPVIRQKCPRFDAWLGRLEQKAGEGLAAPATPESVQ